MMIYHVLLLNFRVSSHIRRYLPRFIQLTHVHVNIGFFCCLWAQNSCRLGSHKWGNLFGQFFFLTVAVVFFLFDRAQLAMSLGVSVPLYGPNPQRWFMPLFWLIFHLFYNWRRVNALFLGRHDQRSAFLPLIMLDRWAVEGLRLLD